MRISRIYYDGILNVGENVDLPVHTSHYIMNVLRLKVGLNVTLFNGDGKEYIATIIIMGRKSVILKVGAFVSRSVDSPLNIHLAQAISRGEKMDLAIQKAVELGVQRITPLVTEFCSVKLNVDRISKRFIHWKKIMISACEQSGRTSLPIFDPIYGYHDWIRQDLAPVMLFCHPSSSRTIASLERSNEVVVLIGPEGGLSEHEIKIAEANNFLSISLGPRILRTETASLAAIAILQHCWGDL